MDLGGIGSVVSELVEYERCQEAHVAGHLLSLRLLHSLPLDVVLIGAGVCASISSIFCAVLSLSGTIETVPVKILQRFL